MNSFQEALDYIRQHGLQLAQAMMFGNPSARWIGITVLQLAETPDDPETQENLVAYVSEYASERISS